MAANLRDGKGIAARDAVIILGNRRTVTAVSFISAAADLARYFQPRLLNDADPDEQQLAVGLVIDANLVLVLGSQRRL